MVLAYVSDVMLVRSAHLAVIVRIARLDLTPTLARQHACYASVALGAVLSGLTMSPPAETVLSEGTRQPLEFRRSRGVINAVLEGSLRSQEPLLRLLVNVVR